MLRKKSLVHIAVLTAGIVLLASSVSEAQRRKQGGRSGFFRGFGGFSILDIKNEALQQELKLTPEQKKRVKQIALQMRGIRALTSDEAVMKELGVSDTQKKKMEEIAQAAFSRETIQKEVGGRDNSNLEEWRKKMAEYRKKVESKVVDVLTASQKQQWKTMLGEPVDTSKFRPQFPFGRRPGGKRPDSKKKRPDV